VCLKHGHGKNQAEKFSDSTLSKIGNCFELKTDKKLFLVIRINIELSII